MDGVIRKKEEKRKKKKEQERMKKEEREQKVDRGDKDDTDTWAKVHDCRILPLQMPFRSCQVYLECKGKGKGRGKGEKIAMSARQLGEGNICKLNYIQSDPVDERERGDEVE